MSQTFRTQRIISIREIDANSRLLQFHMEQLIAGFTRVTRRRPLYVVMTVTDTIPNNEEKDQ